MDVLSLILNVVRVVAQLSVGGPSVNLMFHLVGGDTLIQPALKCGVVESIVTSRDIGFRNIVYLHSGGSEESGLMLGEQ